MASQKLSPKPSPMEKSKPSPKKKKSAKPPPITTSRPSPIPPIVIPKPSPMPSPTRPSPMPHMTPTSTPGLDSPAGPMNMNLFNDDDAPAWHSDLDLGPQPGIRGGPYAIALTKIPPLKVPKTPYIPLVINTLPMIRDIIIPSLCLPDIYAKLTILIAIQSCFTSSSYLPLITVLLFIHFQ
ncbi:uncharacterized protein F4807DRAFT_432732 [Annulohypoxylon truncatum]|uniref:uncharacterized protein n=1 Tax=Annulohypoxylon truncatum TaxID=327061 RepID=UPI0020071FB0|nr:uncharacterized protein F4807DRAFT_432732 [Annulohypoxylon truncatum]KAI1207995.1 hypothetical protein F4807DRAFT_432732 [Annulohypoxylon truncatum]